MWRSDVRLGSFRACFLLLPLCLLAPAGCAPARPAPTGAVSTAPGLAFRDVSATSGLAKFRHTDGSSGRKFFVEQMGSGVAMLDYNGDGRLDVYFCTGAALPGYQGPKPANRLFRNRGDGTFEDVTRDAGVACGRYSVGAAAADYDNDGDTDLYICCFGPNLLYRNNGDGTFTDVSRGAGVAEPRLSSSAAWGDYNGDGFLDLYVANYVKYRLDRDLVCSKFKGHKSYCGPTLYEREEHTFYRNRGDGTFEDVSRAAGIRKKSGNGLGVLWVDYDDDDRPDIFVANDQSPNFLWHNNGDGTFTEVAEDAGVAFGEEGSARAGMGVDGGDFQNDGRMDLMVTNFSEESNGLYQNEGGGVFRDVSFASGMGPATIMFLGFGTAFLDYNRDGWLDLFFANGHVMDDIERYSDSVTWAQSSQLFRNRGDGTFEDASDSSGVSLGKRVARGAAFGDLDNDGRTDVVVSALRESPWHLRNEASPEAHWLGLELLAAKGNPQAVGAKIWVTAGGITQRREVRAGGSYASTNDPRPLFGLGKHTRVDELKVRWPGGATTTIKGPPLDQYLKVKERPQGQR